MGDLNGDGKLDVVTTNNHDDSVSVLLGNGDGTFQAPISYAAGSAPDYVAIDDVNGDGIPDLFVVDENSNTNTVAVLLGKGDGTFGSPTLYDGPTANFGGAIADVNGDGKPDLIAGGNVNVLLGNGDGMFEPGISISGGAQRLAVADLTGNGKPDIIFVNGAYDVVVLQNTTPTWTYDLNADWSDTSNPNGPWTLLAGDTPVPHFASFTPIWGGTPPQPAWAASTTPGDFSPAFWKAVGSASADWQTGDVLMYTAHNGGNYGRANIQFTAPSDGIAEISGVLWNVDNSDGRVSEWQLAVGEHNQIDVGKLTGDGTFTRAHPQTFDFANVSLTAGEQVNLGIFPFSGPADVIGVDLKITLAPSPV